MADNQGSALVFGFVVAPKAIKAGGSRFEGTEHLRRLPGANEATGERFGNPNLVMAERPIKIKHDPSKIRTIHGLFEAGIVLARRAAMEASNRDILVAGDV